MKCDICPHSEGRRCSLLACVYIRIPTQELLRNGTHITGSMWQYKEKVYKSICFDIKLNCYVCVEVKE